MTKHRLRINILDVLIFAVIICVIASLVFRDTIIEFFGEPEIIPISYSVTVSEVSRDYSALFSTGAEVTVSVGTVYAETTLVSKSASASAKDGCYDITIVLSGYGYKKLGKYYTSDGIRLSDGERYRVTIFDTVFEGSYKWVREDAITVE